MIKAKFAYSEPRLGDIEVEGDITEDINEFLIDTIERAYPEAIDIEILEVEKTN